MKNIKEKKLEGMFAQRQIGLDEKIGNLNNTDYREFTEIKMDCFYDEGGIRMDDYALLSARDRLKIKEKAYDIMMRKKVNENKK